MNTTPPHGDSRARSGRWERDVLHGQVPEHPTPQVAGTQYFALDVDEVPATGSRPDRLAGVRPQERVQQHPVDQIVDTAPALPILDVPVPLMGEQLVDVLRFFDTLCPVAEQVIDVPKILLEDIPERRLCREPQLVEQLVEVPTILFFLKQKVDIPVPGGGGRHADLQGFHSGQSSTAPQFSEERIPKRIVEQNVDILGGLQGLRPVQGSTASSSSSVPRSPADWLNSEDKAFEVVFRTFSPPNKSAKVTRNSSARVPESASSSELSAHQLARAARPQDFSDDGNIFREGRRSGYGLTRASGSCSALTLLLTSLGHDSGSASDSVPRRWHGGYFWAWCLVRQWIHGLRQLVGAFGWFSMFSTHLEIGHYVHEPLVSGSSCSLFGVLLAQCLVRLRIHVLYHPGWHLEEFQTFST